MAVPQSLDSSKPSVSQEIQEVNHPDDRHNEALKRQKYQKLIEKAKATFDRISIKYTLGALNDPNDIHVHFDDSKGKGSFGSTINFEKGEITVNDAYKNNTKNWYLSDVRYAQLLLAAEKYNKDISRFNLRKLHYRAIINKDMINVIKNCFPQFTGEKEFKEGSQEFKALAGALFGKSDSRLVEFSLESKSHLSK